MVPAITSRRCPVPRVGCPTTLDTRCHRPRPVARVRVGRWEGRGRGAGRDGDGAADGRHVPHVRVGHHHRQDRPAGGGGGRGQGPLSHRSPVGHRSLNGTRFLGTSHRSFYPVAYSFCFIGFCWQKYYQNQKSKLVLCGFFLSRENDLADDPLVQQIRRRWSREIFALPRSPSQFQSSMYFEG